MSNTTVMIHAAPTKARCYPENGGEVTIDFDDWGYIAIFTGSAELAVDLSEAVSAVLEKHRQLAEAVAA